MIRPLDPSHSTACDAIVVALSDQLRTHGDRLVLVKTLSDRTDPGPEYAETHAFYLAMGFVPVAELDLDPPDPKTRSSCWR
jgi:hypothetical protein